MPTEVTIGYIPVPTAALQLALCYTIGFGIIKDDKQAASILRDYSLQNTKLQSQIQLIDDGIQEASHRSGLFSILEGQGTVQYIDLPQYYRERKLLKRAEVNYELEIRNIQIIFGQSHVLCSLLQTGLVAIYRNQERWKAAEELQVQVIEIRKRVLGEEHPSTLTSIANLASTYWNQGRWKEAEELDVQVIEIRKRVLGEEHPDTLTSIANLASIYRNQGRWKEAEELEVLVIEIRKRVLGEEHPSTLTSMNNLAFTLKSQSRNREAISLMKRCLKLRKKVFGPKHPSIEISLEALHGPRLKAIRQSHKQSLSKSNQIEEVQAPSSPPASNIPGKGASQNRYVLPKPSDPLRKRKRGQDARHRSTPTQDQPPPKRLRTKLSSCTVEEELHPEPATGTSEDSAGPLQYWIQTGRWRK
ncbi:MAG: hypothetical protein Q9166_007691 [cf. Caloplaca sp. 2 TL-2023]